MSTEYDWDDAWDRHLEWAAEGHITEAIESQEKLEEIWRKTDEEAEEKKYRICQWCFQRHPVPGYQLCAWCADYDLESLPYVGYFKKERNEE